MPGEPETVKINRKTVKKNNTLLRNKKPKSFPIICIGGSAGSFQSFEKFFMNMPSDSGMAFIIVMHLDPNHNSGVTDVIQTFSPMPVAEARDGMLIQPDHVYVIPPNKDMGIHNRKLLLFSPGKAHGFRLPIDYFLQSLAEDQWNKAVAIIFSGMGSDGETGLRMIKEKLGMAMVQDPETAQFDSMPKASIGTNLVDYVLSPEEMPVKLIQYMNHPALSEDPTEPVKKEIKDSNSIFKILMILRSQTGHDFSHYKKNTITRRIDRRLAFHQLPDYNHYISYLRENPHEINVLFNELLIGVTKFFRDAQAFESLKEKFYHFLSYKTESEPVRVWVAGCSTGEEAYTIAMLLIECFSNSRVNRVPKIQIFATDLDKEAIETARAGIYHSNIVADVSQDRMERFFVKRNEKFQIKKELREMIVFAQHNLIKDAPFTRLDLLSCRNVMIYLNAELQKKIIPIYHYSLKPKGILLMGPAETIGGFTDMFAPIDPKWKIFERREGSVYSPKVIDFPFNVSKQTINISKKPELKTWGKNSMADNFNRFLLANYTPVSILVDEDGNIMYINGKTGKFLELNSGEAVINIYEMIKDELKYVLRNAIYQAHIQKNDISINDIKVKEDQQTRLVNLKVSLLDTPALHGLVLIVLEDKGLVKKASVKKALKEKNKEANPLAEILEKELEYTKQQLNSTIEQMETSLEELKSTNEELQSMNEELQSTNEESLTTKEEMQSLNEELMTINTSYQAKTEELTHLNNDMKNLLDSTEIGTIFLDNELKILRFTPKIQTLLNVISTDIGRSITDIVLNFDLPNINQLIFNVIETLVAREVEIKTQKNSWFNLRIMPYRTIDNFISGVVLTFTDITSLKIMEHKLATIITYAKTSVSLMQQPALLLDGKLQVIEANNLFTDYFDLKEHDLNGMPFAVLVHEYWKTNRLDKVIKNMADEDVRILLDQDFPQIGNKKFSFNSIPSIDRQTKETLLVLAVIENLPS
ncbi:CheR family methyltransferase [Mucilaginibacter sp.]|uniref:CheR family methyltransferase n=1 Tax=Mucilaginibacter sp. TaxID=1882438 RepID=UPI003B005954